MHFHADQHHVNTPYLPRRKLLPGLHQSKPILETLGKGSLVFCKHLFYY